ncbi:hypothetical protein AB0O65_02195 [Microbacterium sp. NPDC077391]|uniref:hypothetical protein n=1 Tax=Microbacterium sp. NPDC077391 TaxID=3154765 RepID=UPI00343FF341
MPITPSRLPTELGVHFSVECGRESGLTRGRMRAKDLDRPFHGARRAVADITAEKDAIDRDTEPLALTRSSMRLMRSKALSYLQVAAPGSFICGASAAVLRGYPATASSDLDVAVFAPRRAPKGRGVRGRTIRSHLVDIDVVDGIPASSPASTWAMLGRDLSERKLIILGDAIVGIPRDERGIRHPERAGATIEQLQASIDAGSRPGLKKLRAALERIRVGCSSPLETDYRLDAEDARLPEPELDVEIFDARDRRVGISEFVYRQYSVVVEIEGDHHRSSKHQWNRDLQKYRDYASAGWEVVRLTAHDVRTTRRAARIVREVLIRRGWRPEL